MTKLFLLSSAWTPLFGILGFIAAIFVVVLIYQGIANMFNIRFHTRGGNVIEPRRLQEQRAASKKLEIDMYELSTIMREYGRLKYPIDPKFAGIMGADTLVYDGSDDSLKIAARGRTETVINTIKSLRQLRQQNVIDQKEYSDKFIKTISDALA